MDLNFKKMNWLERLVYPLEHPEYPQIKGRLIERRITGEIRGKCAQGEIACQNGIPYREDQTMLYVTDFDRIRIPDDLINFGCLPSVNSRFIFDFTRCSSIQHLIAFLNDEGFTYPQIAEFLRTTFEDAV